MKRSRQKAAGPPAVVAPVEPSAAAPGEAPIAWPSHPLAASEILATRILPLMGHNARDFARAAAVCRGWRAACRAATSTLSVYREMALPLLGNKKGVAFFWSPCGKFLAATVCRPPRLSIWRASTGTLVNEWALDTPATAVPPNILNRTRAVIATFSRDGTRVMTLFRESSHFAVWSVPDGQLLAVNPGDPSVRYVCTDVGVPGSASHGLVRLSSDHGVVDLWDVSPLPGGGALRPHLRGRKEPPVKDTSCGSFAFSPGGSEFAAFSAGIARVYDVASLTQLHAFKSPSDRARASFVPGGPHVLLSWDGGACVRDFSRPEEASAVTTVAWVPGTRFHSWSPSGASYFIIRGTDFQPEKGAKKHALEERRAADGSLIRAIDFGPNGGHTPIAYVSHDAHALVLVPTGSFPSRVVVFD